MGWMIVADVDTEIALGVATVNPLKGCYHLDKGWVATSRTLDVCVNIAGCSFRRLFFVINVFNLLLYFVSNIIGRFFINVLGESAGHKYGKWTFVLYLVCS